MPKYIKKSDEQFIKKSLEELKEQLDRIMEYIQENPWQKMDTNVRSEEFKFQTSLFDSHTKWLKAYLELSGVFEFYEEAMKNQEKESNVRQGHTENSMIAHYKSGELHNMLKNLD